VESTLCTAACAALGETGGIIFALVAFVYAFVQRVRRTQVSAKLDAKSAQNKQLEQERDHFRALSTRPPAGFPSMPSLPVQLVYTPAQVSLSPPAPEIEPHDPDHVDPTEDHS
jgi:hypothetical protein